MTSAAVISRFVRRLGRWHRLLRVLRAVVAHCVVLGVVLAITALLTPGILAEVALGSAAWLSLVAAWAWWRNRMSVDRADRELRLRDGLSTWVRVPRGRAAEPMFSWLERDLEERIERVPPERVRSFGWRPLGLCRYGIPILVILLLLRLLQPPLPPLPEGPLALAGASGSGAGGGGGAADDGQAGADGDDAEKPATPDPPPDPQPVQDPPPAEQQPDELPPEPPPDTTPRALLDDLPTRAEFAVPQFVGDGPSSTAKAHVAALDDTPAAPPPAPQTPAAPPSRDHREPWQDPEFERAAERALRSRHVPDDEKAFVRRYFNSLLDRRK